MKDNNRIVEIQKQCNELLIEFVRQISSDALRKISIIILKKMRIFVIADTHFGHQALHEDYLARPVNFGEMIIRNWKSIIKDEDLVIHLGDVVVGKSNEWDKTIPNLPGRKILILGNHDGKSLSWYLANRFDFCCTSFIWKLYGFDIAFSHEPLSEGDFDLNIHGHLHLNRHREIETGKKHFLFSLERTLYRPLLLETIVKEWVKSNQIK